MPVSPNFCRVDLLIFLGMSVNHRSGETESRLEYRVTWKPGLLGWTWVGE